MSMSTRGRTAGVMLIPPPSKLGVWEQKEGCGAEPAARAKIDAGQAGHGQALAAGHVFLHVMNRVPKNSAGGKVV